MKEWTINSSVEDIALYTAILKTIRTFKARQP